MPPADSIAGKVLVVDDDLAFQNIIQEVLSQAKVACVGARTGEAALKLMAAGDKPRAVIMDGLLPGIRGDEVAARIRATWPKAQLPIIFVSAFFRDVKSRKMLLDTIQVDAVLQKPVTTDDLRRALSKLLHLAPAPTPPSPAEPAAAAPPSPDLISKYLALSIERVNEMRSGLMALGGPGKAPVLKMLATEAHRFRGSGTSYGLPELSRLGAQIGEVLYSSADGELGPGPRAKLVGLVDALAEKLARSAVQDEASSVALGDPGRLEVMVVDGPGALASSVAEGLAGVSARLFGSSEEAFDKAHEFAPDVTFIGADRPGEDGFRAAEKLVAAGLGPVVLMGRKGGLVDRLRALQSGASGYTHPLPDIAALQRVGSQFTRPMGRTVALVVDSDLGSQGKVAEAVAPHGIDVVPCTDPTTLFELLEQANASVAIFDAQTPESLHMIRALRADARHRRTPLLAVVGPSAQDRIAALEAGADDALSKPVDLVELALRARRHAAEHERDRRGSIVDPLTGLFRSAYLREATERSLRLARRGRTLALLAFALDLEQARKVASPLEVDEVICAVASRLRRAFRMSDMVARIADGRFAALLHDVNVKDASRLLKKNVEEVSEATFGQGLQVKLRGAMASFPEVAGGADALFEAAQRELQG